ncbi:MAG: gamma-glutamylcyclotransferase [Dehalococcoidales bacterium]|jgi:gamma-glutamylcyclotransferase (GGCT)/AIG2-like uncharacterized protein YtfP|nr:gamma-glutamylcyclotransferase [Dehalococcoidales bacterium]|tara:strand:- start:1055 stop:1456 length:402 start_codon:yes stop_codon:yes gene_type:complete
MYYFAYGSNLNHRQLLERCPDNQLMFTATLQNYKLIFAGWSRQWRGGQASIKPFRGDKVLGAIYEISERDLRRLDKYEGYPDTYDRLKITVYRDTGESIEAITYIKLSQSEETKPSPEYLATIKQGYRDWGLI